MKSIVKIIETELTYPLRKEILRKNIDLPYTFQGDFDEKTIHIGAYVNDDLVGITTLMPSTNSLFEDSQYQLRGMATSTNVRGLGIGKKILEFAFTVLKEKNITTLWCNAREIAVPFYEKSGFNIMGDLFMVDKVGPHYVMSIQL